jgi:hypothetical protein
MLAASWVEKPNMSDAPIFWESPEPELELDTPLNLSLLSPCINPDLADYPELVGYLLL